MVDLEKRSFATENGFHIKVANKRQMVLTKQIHLVNSTKLAVTVRGSLKSRKNLIGQIGCNLLILSELLNIWDRIVF